MEHPVGSGRRAEVYQRGQRLPGVLRRIVVGVLQLPGVPALPAHVRLLIGEEVGAALPADALVEQPPDGDARAVGPGLLQSEQLAVYLVGHAVQAVVAAVDEHLDEHALRAVAVAVLGVVGGTAQPVPHVEAHAVAHPYPVHGHGVEDPAVLAADAEDGGIQVLASVVHQLDGKGLLPERGRHHAAYTEHATVAYAG